MEDEILNNQLVPIRNNQLVRLENLLSITNRLVFKGIESIFNEAFYLINSKDIEKGSENFCLMLDLNPKYLTVGKIQFYCKFKR